MKKSDNVNEMIAALRKVEFNGLTPEVLVNCETDEEDYNEKRQIFNRKFQFRPTVIVFCECSEHVSAVLLIAESFNKDIRVRSGGHDHEGECSGTDTVLIDFSKMNKVELDKDKNVAKIQPGAIFKDLIVVLNNNNIGIPHGTCGTVGIAGFTMGGGWGPWTRQKGMCCESLVGATIVLGDGTIKTLTPDGPDSDLLWALRGGGGMSYGIVTELMIETFNLPDNTIKFNATWNNSPALQVLEMWESLIAPDANYNLLGTNLQIMAKPLDGQPIEESVHSCVFFGYYAGSQEELDADMERWFVNLPPPDMKYSESDKNSLAAFDAWDRVSTIAVRKGMLGYNPLQLITPDVEGPAPHKISSRLVKAEGLGDEGRKNLIKSLESDLIYAEGGVGGVHCYVTLGAICGSYYRDYNSADHPLGSAFPYKDRPYIIQYQVWWNQDKQAIEAGKEHDVYRYTNEAQDWIEECRKSNFPQTEGAFISFKDSGIPTRDYFLQSFDRLRGIKMNYSKDPKNRFRTRKTII
jgi:hypothetical protein